MSAPELTQDEQRAMESAWAASPMRGASKVGWPWAWRAARDYYTEDALTVRDTEQQEQPKPEWTWARLYTRLDAAILEHKRATAPLRSRDTDRALWAAYEAIDRDLFGVPKRRELRAPTAWTDDSAETLDAAAEQQEQPTARLGGHWVWVEDEPTSTWASCQRCSPTKACPQHQEEAKAYWEGFRIREAEQGARPSQRVTHGRHCICSACAAQDWAEPGLASCGMHGPSCPAVYAPLGAAGDTVSAPSGEQEPAEADPVRAALIELVRLKDCKDGRESVGGSPKIELN